MSDAAENRRPDDLGGALVGERGPELHLPEDLESLPVIMVVGGSPAAQALLRMCRHPPLRPGQIVPITAEEMRSLREDVLMVTLAREAPEGR